MRTHRKLLAFASVALLASCTIEQETLSPKKTAQKLTITANVESGEPATKTELSELDGSVLWTPGDAISLFYGSGTAGGSQFTSTATEKSAVTNFTGTIGVITGGADVALEDTYFWGLYPYSPTASCNGTSVTMTLPAEQKAMAGSFAPGTSPSIGRSQGLSMGFFNIGGGVKFTVTKPGIKRVTLRSNNGELIAGTARVVIGDSGLPSVQEIISGTDAITLEAPEGEYLEVGQFYYMIMFPTVFTGGFTLTLETFTETTTVEKNNSINIGRSFFGRMLNVDGSAEYALKTGNIPIPDANFKAYMVENFDLDSDGEISYAEALAITRILVYNDDITSVHGIEYCINLQKLGCHASVTYDKTLQKYVSNGHLTSLDVSNNTALTSLDCSSNQLTSLDVSNNTALTSLFCDSNQLTSLDVSNNTALEALGCSSNSLTSLDVSNNTALTQLFCYSNQLTSLDVSNNTDLTTLECHDNQLTSLDVSNNTALTTLECYDNQLTSLDVSDCTVLTSLRCNYNQLTSLDVSNNTALTQLSCGSNQLTSLDVSNNTALTGLGCFENQLSSLDVSNNTALTDLQCGSNQLTSLDVSNNTALTQLSCGSNQLTSVDVSNNTQLAYFWCSGNQLTNLNVSKNTALTQLHCGFNQLTTLDVSNNIALTELWCYSNQLTSLNASGDTALTTLWCFDNQLTSLNVSGDTALTNLWCFNNQLTSLDLSSNTVLQYLLCGGNLLTSLDVSNNTVLTQLSCLDMNDDLGNNLLEVLYIASGQTFNSGGIPAGTQIVVKPVGGGNEGFGEGDI